MVADQVVLRGDLLALLGLVGDLDFHRVVGVVEVDDMNVEHQHGIRGDDATWRDKAGLFKLWQELSVGKCT